MIKRTAPYLVSFVVLSLAMCGAVGWGSQASAQTKKEAPLFLDGAASVTPWKRYSDWPQRDMSKFNTLANLASPPAPKEPRKLSGPVIGDAANGQKLVADRTRGGSCLACHVMGQAGNELKTLWHRGDLNQRNPRARD